MTAPVDRRPRKGMNRKPARGLVRSLSRIGTRENMSPPLVRKGPPPHDPSICDRCGAVYHERTWRRGGALRAAVLDRAQWTRCPACEQLADQDEYYGRVIVRGPYAAAHLAEIRGRIANVERRAEFTQPERRVLSAEWDGKMLEILTTSQKLAHRVARELEKAFGGRAKFRWSDTDGTMTATWSHEAR
jgi:hypothetical protein